MTSMNDNSRRLGTDKLYFLKDLGCIAPAKVNHNLHSTSQLTDFLGQVSGSGKDVARGIRVGEGAVVTTARTGVKTGELAKARADVPVIGTPFGEQKARAMRAVSTSVAMPATWPRIHADFLNGRISCASTIRRAASRIPARFSNNQRATPATSRCATASANSSLALLRHWSERFSAASSKSVRNIVEHSSKVSSGGRAGLFTESPKIPRI